MITGYHVDEGARHVSDQNQKFLTSCLNLKYAGNVGLFNN